MAYDEDLAERMRAILAGESGLTEQRMFGGLAFLVDRHMAVAVAGADGLLLRVDPADTEALVAGPRADRFVMRNRPMNGWLSVDVQGMDDAELREWVARGVAFARTLPPK